jgi:uridine kinase
MPIVDTILASIKSEVLNDGIVIGIEGEWGSGKSSLIHLLEQKVSRENS